MTWHLAALYHFFDYPHFEETREKLLAEMARLNIKGSLLITSEGINGTIAGNPKANLEAYLKFIETEIVKGGFEYKESTCAEQPFSKGKVRLKKETISIGEPVSLGMRGQYVEAKDWNALISQPDVILIDARNEYEVHLGTFEGALDPKTRTFKQLPAFVRSGIQPKKDAKIASFCTGGIRCEKFTAWLKQNGYENVYHLKGGILKYFEEVPEEESKWQGECFVFDERISVDHKLEASKTASLCKVCDHTLTPEDRSHPKFMDGVWCPHCEASGY